MGADPDAGAGAPAGEGARAGEEGERAASAEAAASEEAARRSAEAARFAAELAQVPSSRRKNWTPPPWPHREQRLEYWLGLVAQEVTGRLQRMLLDIGVSYAEWGALSILSRRRHAFHVELTRVTGMSKGGVSKMMGRLEQAGLVMREVELSTTWIADPSRSPWEITSLGWATLHVLEAAADENEADLFGHLSDEDHQDLTCALQQLARHHGWGVVGARDGWRDLRETLGEGPRACQKFCVRGSFTPRSALMRSLSVA